MFMASHYIIWCYFIRNDSTLVCYEELSKAIKIAILPLRYIVSRLWGLSTLPDNRLLTVS